MTEPVISVVIPTYNRPTALRCLLHCLSLQDLDPACFEVIVIDDGGDIPLEDLIANYSAHLDLRLQRVAKRGCGPARQAGVELARGRFLAFTDDDCCPLSDWLSRLLVALTASPGTAIGGLTVNGLPGSLWSEATQWLVNRLMTANRAASAYQFAPTSNVAFPRTEFLSIGGLDPRWHDNGGEDRDLCLRWSRAGYGFQLDLGARVLHFHPLSLVQFLQLHYAYGKGAWKVHHECHAGYESPSFYLFLLIGPLWDYPFFFGIRISSAIFLAQLATIAGSLRGATKAGCRS